MSYLAVDALYVPLVGEVRERYHAQVRDGIDISSMLGEMRRTLPKIRRSVTVNLAYSVFGNIIEEAARDSLLPVLLQNRQRLEGYLRQSHSGDSTYLQQQRERVFDLMMDEFESNGGLAAVVNGRGFLKHLEGHEGTRQRLRKYFTKPEVFKTCVETALRYLPQH